MHQMMPPNNQMPDQMMQNQMMPQQQNQLIPKPEQNQLMPPQQQQSMDFPSNFPQNFPGGGYQPQPNQLGIFLIFSKFDIFHAPGHGQVCFEIWQGRNGRPWQLVLLH